MINMKKNYIYLVASLLLAGCAQDAFEEGNLQETDVPQEIKLSAGTHGIEVEGRGVGSVGAGKNEDQWNGEKLTIYAFKKTDKPFESENDEDIYLKGEEATTAAYDSNKATSSDYDNSSSVLTFTGGAKYYPLQGAYNFVGYYTDDAEIGTIQYSGNTMSIPVTIDGSQDLMIADAKLNYTNKELLVESLIEAGKLSDTTTDAATDYIDSEGQPKDNIDEKIATIITKEYDKAYSSYTARRKVQPNMVFNHQLVRLNFYVKAGDEETMAYTQEVSGGTELTPKKERGVYISKIAIGSRTVGNIVVSQDGNIKFDPQSTNETPLLVQSATDGETLESEPVGDTYEIGDSGSTVNFVDNKANKVGKGILVMLPTNTDDMTEGANKYI